MNKQGELLLAHGKFAEARALFNDLVVSNPGDLLAYIGLAQSLVGLGKLEEAIPICERALEIDPKLLFAYGTLGSIYQRLGRFEEANICSRRAIEIEPRHFKPYVEIVRCTRITDADSPILAKLAEMVREPARPDAEKFHIHWALGKANDDLGNFESAIQHFDAACRIVRQYEGPHLAYNSGAREQEAAFIKQSFPRAAFGLEPAREGGPILIVGMIRSGTTLLDTMLSRLPDVASAGELIFWEQQAQRIFLALQGRPVCRDDCAEAATRYQGTLSVAQPGAKRVIDKMPNNYRHLGLIHLSLPDAKIIHMQRHPVDTCLSIYTTDFGPRPPQFAFHRANIVHAYRIYEDLMTYWRDVLPPGTILDVNYEDLVQNPEPTLRRVLDFLGLPWDREVLNVKEGKGDVTTPSRWQARQPIYRSSLNRWENYLPWLGEFSQLLPNSEVQQGIRT